LVPKYLLSTLAISLLIEILLGGQAFAQFKEYKDQFGRFSIQIPQDWSIGSPDIKEDSVTISFDSPNPDDNQFIMTAGDRHTKASEDVFEQVIREQNTYTISHLPGAALVQDTDCTKYVIDGQKTCSMIYTVTKDQYTEKELEIDFVTEKQDISISVTGSADIFDKYLPIVQKMLDSIKAP
jgi:hypothetical protein